MMLPVDSSILSQILYEGYLVFRKFGSMKNAFQHFRNTISGARFSLVGNDLTQLKRSGGLKRVGFPEQVLMYLYTSLSKNQIIQRAMAGRVYKDLFDVGFMDEIINSQNIQKINVVLNDISFVLSQKTVILGGSKEITAPQFLKVDRYTGFSSLESGLMSTQVTMYMSGKVALVFLLGLYSSYLLSRANSHYFLFFSPSEVQHLVYANQNVIDSYFIIKDTFKKELAKILRKISHGELILLEVMVNGEIFKVIQKSGINYISLNLFRVDREGQTYKVYEHIPIDYFRVRAFLRIARKYFRNVARFLDTISSLIDTSKSPLVDAVGSIGSSRKFAESDNAFNALMGLYRFILLDDVQGWWQFVRELNNCYNKLKSGTGKELKRSRWYKRALVSLSWL